MTSRDWVTVKYTIDAMRMQPAPSVTAIAGLCGLPEVTIPAGRVGGAPVGLSLVGAPGSDRALLGLVEAVLALARRVDRFAGRTDLEALEYAALHPGGPLDRVGAARSD